ncbi:type VI secretion protein [Geomonas silvestris]|uniref:Type VI secretion protein n=1 Tax=Geomonas silvestris TaxID=2740184 RepID=A0A6V8ME69_9BACT|nr:type VI secretion system contractile sheath small subunit [Geomonas silvestris]GFO58123.1 type VI secretion protein [Geomonas silvestris]
MTKEATVAPRERVNIVYRPSLEDAREEVELPLKMLVLGDFTGSGDQRPVEMRTPVSVERTSLDEVLKAQGVTLAIAVEDRIGCLGGGLAVTLSIESMRDFTPQAIVEQVPELRRLVELREALRALKGPLANLPEFRRKLQEAIGDEAARQRVLSVAASD